MANYYTNFSVILPLADAAQKAYALALAQQAGTSRFEETELPADFPPALKDVVEDWTFEAAECEEGLWLHSDSGGMEAVCAFVQHLLQKFNPAGSVALEWSHDCSKPRTDAFGGGAAYITATEIKTMTTAEWLRSVAV